MVEYGGGLWQLGGGKTVVATPEGKDKQGYVKK